MTHTLVPPSRQQLSLRIAPWERKRVGVVFGDLSDFVAFTEAEGDDAAARLVLLNLVTATPLARCRGGHIVKHLGDGLLGWFPDPAQAVLASVELARASSDILPMRVGAHWGDVICTGGDLLGHSVNVAARLVGLAEPGEVLVTSQLREAAGELAGVRYGTSRTRRARGLRHRMRVSTARLTDGERES